MISYARKLFNAQKYNASLRSIPFLLTFDEWYNWWLQNGVDRHLPRTTNGNTLCMCRFNDLGSYELSNIYCATLRQNSIDGQKNKPRGAIGKQIKTPLGIFPSRISASIAYDVSQVTIARWLKVKSNDFYYL